MTDRKKNKRNLYSFCAAFHSKGAEAYSTVMARRLYGLSLLKLADKLFWAPIATLIVAGLTNRSDHFMFQCVMASCLAVLGMYLRHCGLAIIDLLPERSVKNGHDN